MKFVYPVDRAWLSEAGWKALAAPATSAWQVLDRADPLTSDAFRFQSLQNDAMLAKFFLQQAFGDGVPRARAKRLIERDFATVERFADLQRELALDDRVEWVAWCMSFATNRFHLFPITREAGATPFCTSPMSVLCTRKDVVELSGLSREKFVRTQLAAIDYGVVENRIACLEKPLDVFEELADCQADACST